LKRTHSFLAPALLLAALIAIVLAFVALANTILIACIVLTRYGSRQGKLLQKVGTGVDEFLRTALQLFSLRPPLEKKRKERGKKKDRVNPRQCEQLHTEVSESSSHDGSHDRLPCPPREGQSPYRIHPIPVPGA
jgi:hypothetical protein